eukprot:CCRYP_020252-RC/>CCRYP_020252-RC protein AED:0.49 eAED:1.00 QI:0/0/0/1/0/0/2/0/65
MVASEGCMCKFLRMSRWTRGTAVAVRASMGMEDSMGWFPPTNFSGVTYTKRNSPLNALSSMEASV